MTHCPECGYDWDGPPENAVTTISTFPADIARLLSADGVENGTSRLRVRPAAEVWSPLEYIAHTGDAIDWYTGRINRVLTEHCPALDPFDWDAHTASQRYHDRHLGDVLDHVSRSCARFAAVAADLTAADWDRDGTGSDGQPRSITQLTRRAAHEAQHHLRDIQVGLSAYERGQKP